MHGTSESGTFWYILVFQIVIVVLLSGYAVTVAGINCPNLETLQVTNNSVTDSLNVIATLSSPCTGIPWWVWVIVLLPGLIAMGIVITPFIG